MNATVLSLLSCIFVMLYTQRFRLYMFCSFPLSEPYNPPSWWTFKRFHPKSNYRIRQATHFSTENPVNKPAMNNRRLLIAAVFHFLHPEEKDSSKHHKLRQNSVSFSCQSKQLSRCCINFPHELACQILTNQSIKTGRRAWATRDHGKIRSSLPVLLKKMAEFSRPWSVWNQNPTSAGP